MQVKAAIEKKLTAALAPTRLPSPTNPISMPVTAAPVRKRRDSFPGRGCLRPLRRRGRVQRQRLVYEILAEELKGPVHALALKTRTPEEDRAVTKEG